MHQWHSILMEVSEQPFCLRVIEQSNRPPLKTLSGVRAKPNMGSVPRHQRILTNWSTFFGREEYCVFFSLLLCVAQLRARPSPERVWRFVFDNDSSMGSISKTHITIRPLESSIKLERRPWD